MRAGDKVRFIEKPTYGSEMEVKVGETGKLVEYEYSIADPMHTGHILNLWVVELDKKVKCSECGDAKIPSLVGGRNA